MTLDSVPDNIESESPYRRAVLLLHVLHLGSFLLLLRPLLVAGEESHLEKHWKLDVSPAELREYQIRAEAAAHQISKVSRVLYTDPTFTRRCWITK
jgi:hypothetical protein